MLKSWLKKFNSRLATDGNFSFVIKSLTGYKPRNSALFELAFVHSSASIEVDGKKLNYERLEFLGDAILGAIVADYLYAQFPEKEEGFLTTMRSKIVSRKHLNSVALKLGIDLWVKQKTSGATQAKSINGDVFEALIGALYLDRGYECCRKFIQQKIISDLIDLSHLQDSIASHKSALLEWGAKNRKGIDFKLIEATGKSHARQYTVEVYCDGEPLGQGRASSKKKAEEAAAQRAYNALLLKNGAAET